MKKLFSNYILATTSFIILLINFNCQRDDICDASEVTPRLIINFIDDDINNTDNLAKNVESLAIRLIVDKNNPENPENRFLTNTLSAPTTSSLILPLNTLDNTITYVFTRNFGNDNPALIQEDTLVFSYTSKNNFVNRACGFQTTFDNLNLKRKTEVWISNQDILKTTIIDEETRHLLLFH